MTLAVDYYDELINMRNEGLRCLHAARDEGDDQELTKWQHCISRIEAMLTRRRSEDLA